MDAVYPSRHEAVVAALTEDLGSESAHTVPDEEADGHILSAGCWCAPEELTGEDGRRVFVHHEVA